MTDLIDVIIADDSYVNREGMRHLIGSMSDYRIVAEVGESARLGALSSLIDQLAPHLVIVDLKWGCDETVGLDVVSSLKGCGSTVVALSAHPELLARAEQFGAHATLSKDMDRAQMVAAINAIARPGVKALPRGAFSTWHGRLTSSIRSFLDAECSEDVARLTADGLALVVQSMPKVEAIERLCPAHLVPTTDSFELFRIGPDGARYRELQRRASRAGVPPALLSASSLIVGFETAEILKWEGRRLGLQVDSLQLTVNLDAPAITSGLAAAVLQRYKGVLGFVALEVHEAIKGKLAIVALEELLESFGAIVVLDDVNKLDAAVRRRLHKRVRSAKIDFRAFQAMAKDLGTYGEAVIQELLSEAREKPLIVEGVAEQIHLDFLSGRWPRNAPPLYIQGHRVHPRSPWTRVLAPLGDLGHPSGYTLRV
jgi:DNA-binding NarL/FixJ family response regulator